MTPHAAMWIVTVASLVGTVANIYKRRWCFYVWGATNALWAVYDFWLGAHAQGTLMCVYFGLAIWGLYHWRSKDGQEDEDSSNRG